MQSTVWEHTGPVTKYLPNQGISLQSQRDCDLLGYSSPGSGMVLGIYQLLKEIN